ncbi:MAG: hypothetical protein AB7Q17_11230 [Phycisphaerae bacterium]
MQAARSDPPLAGPTTPRRAALLVALVVATTPITRAQPRADFLRDWPAPLHAALHAYRDDDLSAARRAAEQVAAATSEPALRRDAAALGALVLLRSESRADRVNARAQLSALAEEDPTLFERPECALALGIASRELGETAIALDQLDHARRAFEARGDTPRLARTLVALAETWLRHGEWSATPAQFRAPRPDSAEHADRLRHEQALRVVTQLEALDGAVAAAHTARLRVAEHLLPRDERAADALLTQLVETAPWTDACAAAALQLAERYEQAGQTDAAGALYEQAADPRWGATATTAGARLAAMRKPSITLAAPAQAPSGEPLRFELRVRGVERVVVEARRVDLEAWLTQNRGRPAFATLPTSGAAVLSREIETRGGAAWSSDALASPLVLDAPAGAYVLSAAAGSADGEPADRRLVVLSDLRAAAWVGRLSATIGALRAPDIDALRGLFWIHGAPAPTRLRFADRVATFELPADVRVRRERRWTALVGAGAHWTVLAGELDPGAGEPALPTCLLTATPANPHAGDPVSVAGLAIGTGPGRGGDDADYRVDLVDAFEQRVASAAAAIERGGVFATVVTVPSTAAGRPLRALLRSHERTIENRLGRTPVRVAPADDSPLRLRVAPQPWFARPDRDALLRTTLTFDVFAEYPWGTPADLNGVAGLRALLLNATTAGGPAQPGPVRHFHPDRSQRGRMRFVTPIAGLQPEAVPFGVGLFAQLLPLDGRMQGVDAAVLLGPRRAHAWLELEAADPALGRPLACRLAWFDPDGRLRPDAAELLIEDAAARRSHQMFFADVDGRRCATWRPAAAGAHVARARVPWTDPDAAPLEIECRFDVAAGADEPFSLDLTAERIQRDRQWGARVRVRAVTPPAATPILLTAFTGGEPLGAAIHLPGESTDEVFIPFARDSAPDARVVAATLGGNGLRLLDIVPIAPPAPLTLTLDPPQVRAASGGRARFRIACERDGRPATNAALLVRLVDATPPGVLAWLPTSIDAPADPPAVSAAVGGSGEIALSAADQNRLGRALSDAPAELAAAIVEGETRWVDAYTAGGAARDIEVPLPGHLERGRLIVLARTADGAVAIARAEIRVAPRLTLELDLPPRLRVGDRSLAAIRVHNPHADERCVRLALAPGPGLALERVRPAAGDALGRDDDEAWTLTLPPAGDRLILAEVEAAAACSGVFEAAAIEGAARCVERAAYEISDLDAATAHHDAPRVTLRRTLLALVPAAATAFQPQDQSTLSGMRPSRWERYVLDARARVPAGRLLLVREEFELSESWRDVEWSQTLPPACHTVRGEPDDVHALSRDPLRRLDEYRFRLGAIPAGTRVHEYFALAVRPGVNRIPPPEIVVGGQRVAVELDPRDAVLTVYDDSH